MVNGIKGLSGVKEEEKAIKALLNSFEKESVDVKNVVTTLPTIEETLLTGLDDF